MKKVWIVWFDGYLDRWGSYNYLLGVYDTEELANQAKALLIDQYSELLNRVYIRRVMLNKTLKAQTPFLTDVAHEIETDICLGGYCE